MKPSLQSQLDQQWQHVPQHLMHGYVHTFPINEEHHLVEIMRDLEKRSAPPAMHIGVAGFANLEMAARAKSNAVVLCDLNQNQVLFWRSVFQLLAENDTPKAFRAAFESRLTPPDQFALLGDREEVTLRYKDLKRSADESGNPFLKKQYWLTHPTAYQHLHALAKAGKMATVPLDILDVAQCEALHAALGECRIDGAPPTVGSVYAANVFDIVQEHPSHSIYAGLEALQLFMQQYPAENGAISEKAMSCFGDYLVGGARLLPEIDGPDADATDAIRAQAPTLATALLRAIADPAIR